MHPISRSNYFAKLILTLNQNGCTEASAFLNLHDRRLFRHYNGHRNTELHSVIAQTLRVIAQRRRHDPGPLLLRSEMEQSVSSASLFEAAGELLEFFLQVNLHAADFRQM